MSFPDRFAVLLDGEFVKKVLQGKVGRFPSEQDVMSEVKRIRAHEVLASTPLYRVFYYTAEPLTGVVKHPLDGTTIDFGRTAQFARNSKLIARIENQPDVAVRRGTLVHQGWQIGASAAKALADGSKKEVGGSDIQPKISQKGVDMRIGLDIASLAIKRLVSTIVVVSGDADLTPAMKLARREGLRVILDALGRSVRQELKVHADQVL